MAEAEHPKKQHPDKLEPSNEMPSLQVNLGKISEKAAVDTVIRHMQQQSQRDMEEVIKLGSAVKQYVAEEAKRAGYDDLLSYLQDAASFFRTYRDALPTLLTRSYLLTKMRERDHWLKVLLLMNAYGTPCQEDLRKIIDIIDESLRYG